jgi:hypothetical protein
MASLLDQLIAANGNSASNPYATQPTDQSSQGPSISIPVASIGSLIDSLGRGSNNPYANVASYQQPSAAATAARQGQDAVTPYQAPSAAATADRQGANNPTAPAQAPTSAQGPATQAASAQNSPVAQVNATSSFPSASDYNADGTQATPGSDASASQQSAGGLLGSLAGAASDAVNDPVKSKGLLSTLGGAVSNIGNKLQSLSPAASQGLIAAGMTILQNNDGRHNLAQLVGDGGVAGANVYQQVNQNRILAAKNLIDMQHMQNQDATAAQEAATKQWQAMHPTLNPDQAVVNAAGGGGAPVTSGVTKSYGTIDVVQPDGSTMTFQKDIAGNQIPGTGVISKNPNVGPLDAPHQKTVDDISAQATKDQQALTRTQTMLTQLQGANIPAGLKAKGQDLWTQLTGDQTTGQVLRNQLQQQAYQDFLSTWKPGIGGRLTNTDVNLLKQGMPPDTASSQTWTKFLTQYGKLQSDVSDQSTRGSAFAAQNRGDLGPLHAPLTTSVVRNNAQGVPTQMQVTFPAGTPYQQVVMGQGGTQATQSGQNGPSNAALLAEAQRRGLKQNANGQWIVSQQSQ